MQCKLCQQELMSDMMFIDLFKPSQLTICTSCHYTFHQQQWQFEQIKDIPHYYLYDYQPIVRQLISDYKFKGDLMMGEFLAPMIRSFFNKHPFDIIIPIPISPERKMQRTFNQCEQLLKQASVPFQSILASHFREHQFSLSKQQRRNLNNPFYLVQDDSFKEKRTICLFDDIYTTGQTTQHAIEVLNKTVTIVTLAKVLRHK